VKEKTQISATGWRIDIGFVLTSDAISLSDQLDHMHRTRGFTLLEMLVVLVIIGVIVSLATLSFGVLGRDTQVQDQSERLATIMSQVQEEAELQGRQFGVLVESDGYEFLIFDAVSQSWQPVSDDDFLQAVTFPDGLTAKLWLEGRPVVLKSHAERPKKVIEKESEKNELDKEAPAQKSGGLFGSKDDANLKPQLFLLSSGEINSFELRIERENTDHIWHVIAKPDNTLLAEEVDDSK
jgi:general secretion pathway protein H